MKQRLCWLCGDRLGKHLAFVLGPMCAITRTTSEPPCHLECARYAVQVCPFLSRPRMRRNDVNWPSEHRWLPGLAIERNPGVSAIWSTLDYRHWKPGGGGVLFTVGDPLAVEWWREARAATRSEVRESIESGLPLLRESADKQDAEWPAIAADDPAGARHALEHKYIPRLESVLPAEQ